MKQLLLISTIIFSLNTLATVEEVEAHCVAKIEQYEVVAGEQGANEISAAAAKDAFMSCVESLRPADIFLATSLRSRCLRSYRGDEARHKALAENCALEGLKYLKNNE